MPDISNILSQSTLDLVKNIGLNENQTESEDMRLALNNEKIFGTKNLFDRNANPSAKDYTSQSFIDKFSLENSANSTLLSDPDVGSNKAKLLARVGLPKPGSPNFSFLDERFQEIIIETEFKIDTDASGKAQSLKIKFDSTPESIAFSRTATWTPTQILGRPEPVQIYSAVSNIQSSLEGWFFVNSNDQLEQKLKISDYLMALVTPSKKYFMPTPVKISIGTWKTIRAVITNVNITFEGPWSLPPENFTPPDNLVETKSGQGWSGIVHAPYLFKVQFGYVLVNSGNKVKYAEDIVKSGFDVGNWGTSPSQSTPEDTSNADPTDDSKDPQKNELPVIVPESFTDFKVGVKYAFAPSGPATKLDLEEKDTRPTTAVIRDGFAFFPSSGGK